MINHARLARETAERIAGEVRAALARESKTPMQLAEVLDLSPATTRSRLKGKTPFTVIELTRISIWLSIPIETFVMKGVA